MKKFEKLDTMSLPIIYIMDIQVSKQAGDVLSREDWHETIESVREGEFSVESASSDFRIRDIIGELMNKEGRIFDQFGRVIQ